MNGLGKHTVGWPLLLGVPQPFLFLLSSNSPRSLTGFYLAVLSGTWAQDVPTEAALGSTSSLHCLKQGSWEPCGIYPGGAWPFPPVKIPSHHACVQHATAA